MYYQTTFAIRDPSERRLRGNDLLNAVRVLTEETLKISPEESTTEAQSAGQAAYWELTVERPTLDESGNAVRLEVRAYSQNGRVTAQIVTRYLRNSSAPEQELPTFPPNILFVLAKRFDCIAGTTAIRNRPRTINRYNVQRFIKEQVLNPRRTIPLLVITKNRKGETEADPYRLQKAIAGASQAVVMERGTETVLRDAIGRATYNGKMRLINTQLNRRHEYYDEQPELRNLVSQCLKLATDPRFDNPFTRTSQQVHDNLAPTQQEGIPVLTLNDHIQAVREAGIQVITAETNAKTANPDTTPEPNSQETDTEKEAMADKITELSRLLEEERNQNQINAPIRTIPLEQDNTYNITVMNHALNLTRDPLRRYIVSQMSSQFGVQTTEKLIATIDMRHNNSNKVKTQPEACLDINDFANIVSNYQQCFNRDGIQATELSRLFREMKSIRNRASHPPLDGIRREETIDKLQVVQQIMGYVGLSDHNNEINSLITMQSTPI